MTTIIHLHARSLAAIAFLVSIISTGCVCYFSLPMPPTNQISIHFQSSGRGVMATEEEDEAQMSVYPSHIFSMMG